MVQDLSMPATTGKTLIDVKGLKVHFPIKGGILNRTVATVKAVDGVDLFVPRGETLGLVGESGCGKSTTGRAILQLIRPTAGSVSFEGVDLTKLSNDQVRRKRSEMQMICQDPYGSLDPRFTVGQIISEPLENFKRGNQKEVRDEVGHLLEVVGLNPYYVNRFPHEFSGGQRQRIGIARALALHPKLVIADEPVSALDVSIQAQVLNLLKDLQRELGLAYLYIAHRIAVMYLGRIVELTDKKTLFTQPLHPYTEQLLLAVPVPDPKVKRQKRVLQGDVPSPINPPSGCHFHTRCPYAVERCRMESPPLREVNP